MKQHMNHANIVLLKSVASRAKNINYLLCNNCEQINNQVDRNV